MNKRDGISLITLVITIVIIVILTGTIILSISSNNPINQAQKAVIREDIASMIEQHDLIYATELGKYNGDKSKIEDVAFEEIVPTKYRPDLVANKGGLEYNCKDEKIKDIIKEMSTEKVILTCELTKPTISNIAAGNITETTAQITVVAVPGAEGSAIASYKYSIDNGVTYKESRSNIITVSDLSSGTETIVRVKAVDSNGRESAEKTVIVITKTIIEGLTIPEGFCYVGGTKDTGIVISDNRADKDKGDSYEAAKILVGNQYVWIPIASGTEFIRREWNKGNLLESCTEPYASGYSAEVAEYNDMKSNVVSNQGFYIARYEASNNNGTAESKALKNPWAGIKWSNNAAMNTEPAERTASYEGRHVSDKLGYTSVQSTLIYGVQWDSALKFIENIGTSVVDSTSWGNYDDVTFNYITTSNTEATKTTSIIIPTGATARHMKQNISDMAGNVWEWTMEANSNMYRNFRGGGCGYKGDNSPASYRSNNVPNFSNADLGFRVALYVK